MKPLKIKRIEIRKPRYDPNPEKSKTDNHDWRVGLFLVFEDYNGNEYDYMPKWNELDLVNERKYRVEELNRELARKHKIMGVEE